MYPCHIFSYSVPSHYLIQCWLIIISSHQVYYDLEPSGIYHMNLITKTFSQAKCIWKCCLQNSSHFLQTSTCSWWISINGKTKVKTKWDDLYISEAASLMTSPHGKALFAMWYSRHWRGQWTLYFNSFYPEFISGNVELYFDGLVQDCRISSANALEILQTCTKPSICTFYHFSTLKTHRWLNSFLAEDRGLFIMHIQYHGCWCPGNASSHDCQCLGPWVTRSSAAMVFTVRWQIFNHLRHLCIEKW